MTNAQPRTDYPPDRVPACDQTSADVVDTEAQAEVVGVARQAAEWERFFAALRRQVRHNQTRRQHVLTRFAGNNLIQLRERLRFFDETGDHDWLIDVANFAGREWVAREASNV